MYRWEQTERKKQNEIGGERKEVRWGKWKGKGQK